MARIVVLSDIHLSPTHGFFWENWCVAREFANAQRADAVIVNGDLAINGPDSDAEIAFAARAVAALRPPSPAPVLVLPGNHDVGDEPPGQDPDQIIDDERLARWDRSFAADRFVVDAGSFRLIGINAQLCGSGLARERLQDQWLDEQLSSAGGRPVALFLHKPLFMETPAEATATSACMVPPARARLIARLDRADVRLVVSGHLHQHRERTVAGRRQLWLPAVAFAGDPVPGGDTRCGLVVLDFADGGVEVTVERPPGLVSHDLKAIRGSYPFLRDMPPCPPPAAGDGDPDVRIEHRDGSGRR